MRRTSCAIPRIFTGLALASALCLPAAAIAAQFDFYIKLPPIEGDSGKSKSHRGEIEIHSFAWGTGQSAKQIQEISGLKYEVDVVDMPGPASKDMTLKGSKIGENSAAKKLPGKRTPPTVTLKRGAAATGASSGPVFQYNPKELSVDKNVPWNSGQPAPSGTVTVRGKLPSCTVGVRYPTLEIGVRGKRYTLADVVVSSCGGSADGGSQPMEEVSFNYAKIKT